MSSSESAGAPDNSGWRASFYHSEATLSCSLEDAWRLLLNIPSWNPAFVGATTIPICGDSNSEGELVEISFTDATGVSQPPFFARTIKVVPDRLIAWYCYPKLDDAFRIFLEFSLIEVPAGIRFSIQWYALDRVSPEALAAHRTTTNATVQNLALAFKAYCQANST